MSRSAIYGFSRQLVLGGLICDLLRPDLFVEALLFFWCFFFLSCVGVVNYVGIGIMCVLASLFSQLRLACHCHCCILFFV